jgi:hypothetical protein
MRQELIELAIAYARANACTPPELTSQERAYVLGVLEDETAERLERGGACIPDGEWVRCNGGWIRFVKE